MTKGSEREARIQEYYDTISKTYDLSEEGALVRLCMAITWPWIRGNLPARRCRVLDAGGGTGRWAIPLAREGHSVALLDISQGMLDRAREKAEQDGVSDRVECRKGSFEEVPYPEASFDVVLCEADAFGLAENTQRALTEFRRALVAGGVVLLGVSNTLNLITIKTMNKKDLGGLSRFLEDLLHREPSPRALARHYGIADARRLDSKESPRFATFTPVQIERMLDGAGFTEISVTPRITFADYLDPSILLEVRRDEGLFQRIVNLEGRVAQIEGSAAIGGHLLVRARKADDGSGRA